MADPAVTSRYKLYAGRLAEEGLRYRRPAETYLGSDALRVRQAWPTRWAIAVLLHHPQHKRFWSSSRPALVDGKRMGFYGLSYGCKRR